MRSIRQSGGIGPSQRAPHDPGIFGQAVLREIDMVAVRRIERIEPVACRLKGHTEMNCAGFPAGKARNHQHRPATGEFLTIRAVVDMSTPCRFGPPAPPLKWIGMGHLSASDLRLREPGRMTGLKLDHHQPPHPKEAR